MKMKISSFQYFALKLRDGRHNDRGGRVVFPTRRWKSCKESVCWPPSEPENGKHKDFLTDLDDQMWRDLSDDWQKYQSEEEEKFRPIDNDHVWELWQNGELASQTLRNRKGPTTNGSNVRRNREEERFPCFLGPTRHDVNFTTQAW